jgi:putative chitinase
MRQRGIHGPRRVAAFLATVAHESNGGRSLEESLNYSADRCMAVWPGRFPTREAADRVARNPEALAEAVYGHRLGNAFPGDGWKFRGRGLIQLTGAENYGAAADALGLPLLASPDLAAEPEVAAIVAAWWWAAHGCTELADAGEPEAWRKRVNGGLNGMQDVRRRYAAVLAAIGAGG